MPSDSVDDSSESSETSASETVFSTDTGLTPPPPPPRRGGTATGTKSSPSRNKSGKNPFDSMIEDWMGDEPSVFSVDSRANSGTFPSAGFGRSGGHGGILAGIGAGRNNARNPNHRLVDIPNVDDGRGTRGNAQPDHDNDDDNDAHAVEDGKKKGKKKKLVPYTSSSSSSRSPKPFPPMTRTITPPLRRNDALDSAPPSERRLDDRPKCYLIQGTQTQGSLIEQYVLRPLPDGSSSSSSPPNYLAHWSPPKDRTIPKFKFASSNYGKSELVNATQGDLRGKRAYYSGICQWLRSAKTFLGEVVFVRHVVGWECDLYFYFGGGGGGGRGWTLVELFGHDVPDDGFGRHVPRQTVLLRDGQPFGHLDNALAVAIVPRGSDFLHYDPRFQTSIEKWVAEGSKLGFASKLDVRAGSGYPKQASHRAVGDAARPSGGKWYNDVAREYEIDEGGGEGEGPWESRKRRSDLETEGKGNIGEQERNDVVKKAVGVVASREMRRFSSPKQSEVEGTSQQTPQNQPTKLPHPSSANGGIRRRSSQESITSATGISSTKPRLKSKSPIDIEPIPQESRMTPGTHVYVRDAHYSWIPATVLAHPDSLASPAPRLRVRIRLPSDWEDRTIVPKGGDPSSIELERTVKLSDYPNRELPLQNLEKDGKTVMGKNDMADLPNLHEAAILYNLKERHSGGVPYTRVGDIMVAMNPFQWIDGLYSEEKKFFYAKNLIWQAQPKPTKPVTEENGNQPLATAASERQAIGYEHEKLGIDPHVFETASLAYLGLALDGSNQTILVTGESGAGKTETIKIVMNHLATVERSRPNWPESDRDMGSEHGSDTVNRVLRANPVFEAFGNAKTLRNDNSSRFGKFTQLQFDVEDTSYANLNGRAIPSCLLAGSKCITYLLEKSRVVSVSQGERTYHIFYQLLEAPDEIKKEIWEEGLVGASTADFNYLSTSSAQEHGFDSGEEWTETVDALSTFGIKGDAFFNVMRSLCVILQLGNLTFEPEVVDGEERSSISSIEALEKLSTLMGVPESEIETAMTKRFMITRGEEFTISLKDSEARDGCDALAKEIYARVFDYLVRKINECTEPKGSADGVYGTISLLDIFGFESFQVNRFEQLCINYANERLQQKYVVDNFRAIKVEYEEEGINVFDFSLIDNSDVMDLLEGKMGLMVQLNEECVRPNGGDESFVYKLKVVCSDSNRLIQDNLHRPYEFGIRHYAAPIKYDARKFIERNLDKIPNDLLKCACHSANPLIRQEFQRLSDSLKEGQSTGLKKRSAATKHLVATKFRSQLTSLMSIIEESRTRYIRCVKPNKVMRPRTLDHAHTVSQLESAGLVTAIVISRESFPNRLSYDVIMERFKFLTYKYADCHLDTGDIKQDSEILLSHLLAGITADTHMGRVRPFACGKTKVYFRVGALERIETIRQEYYAERAIQLQTWVRSLQARIHYLIMKRGMILLESQIRCYLVRRSYKMKLKCALIVQCFIRRVLAKLEYLRRRNNHAATVIQTRWRVIKPRREFRAAHLASIKIQSIARMTICKKVYAAKKKERDAEHAMESRMTMMQQNFDDASTVGGGGTVFSVDEGLLEEVETMFEFLRKEIVVLRKKNTKLKRELAESEAEKREMFNHASSTEHAFALSKIRSEQLTRNNAQLTENANRFKKEISKLKTELKTQQYGHELQLREMRQEFDMALERRDAEVKTLESKLQTTTAMHKREVQLITDDAERNREENYAEIMRLREEIKRTQDSHQDYLSKLMGVLETTQANRSTSPDAEELIREKDSQIIELQTELAKLQKSTGTTPQDNKTRKDTIRSMKYIVKKNREHRKVRVQEIDQLVNQLEVRLSPDVRSESQDIIDSLRDAIQYDEKCNSKMDREVVNMIEHSSSYYIPLDVSNQNADYGAIVAENQKLRRKLEKKYTCKKCGFRREKKDHHDDDGSGDFGDSTMIESAVGGSSSKFLESVVEE